MTDNELIKFAFVTIALVDNSNATFQPVYEKWLTRLLARKIARSGKGRGVLMADVVVFAGFTKLHIQATPRGRFNVRARWRAGALIHVLFRIGG